MQNIPHLNMLLSPIYLVTQKVCSFDGGPEQEKSLYHVRDAKQVVLPSMPSDL